MKCAKCKEEAQAIAKDYTYWGEKPVCTKCLFEDRAEKRQKTKARLEIIRSWSCGDLTDGR